MTSSMVHPRPKYVYEPPTATSPPASSDIRLCKPLSSVMMPQHRAVQRPLKKWLSLLETKFAAYHALDHTDPPTCLTFLGYFNELALVLTVYGRPDLAYNTCHHTLLWLDRFVKKTGALACYCAGFDSYINMARLQRLNNNWGTSLDMFRAFERLLAEKDLSLGPIHLTNEAIGACLSQAHVEQVLRTHVSLEPIKTFLSAGRTSSLQKFCALRIGKPDRYGIDYVREGLIVSHLLNAESKEALRAIEQGLGDRESGGRAVFLLRYAETQLLLNDLHTCHRTLQRLAGTILSTEKALTLQQMHFVRHLAELSLRSGFMELGMDLAHSGLAVATDAEDVSLQAAFLSMLSVCDKRGERETYHERRKKLLDDAWYGVGKPSSPQPQAAHAIQMLSIYESGLSFLNSE